MVSPTVFAGVPVLGDILVNGKLYTEDGLCTIEKYKLFATPYPGGLLAEPGPSVFPVGLLYYVNM